MFSPASILQTPNVNLQVIFMSLLLSFKAKVRPFFSSRNVLNVSPFCLALPKQPHRVPRASPMPSIFLAFMLYYRRLFPFIANLVNATWS